MEKLEKQEKQEKKVYRVSLPERFVYVKATDEDEAREIADDNFANDDSWADDYIIHEIDIVEPDPDD